MSARTHRWLSKHARKIQSTTPGLGALEPSHRCQINLQFEHSAYFAGSKHPREFIFKDDCVPKVSEDQHHQANVSEMQYLLKDVPEDHHPPKDVTDEQYPLKEVLKDQYTPEKALEMQYTPKEVLETLYLLKEISEDQNPQERVSEDLYSSKKMSGLQYTPMNVSEDLYSSKKMSGLQYTPMNVSEDLYSSKKMSGMQYTPKDISEDLYLSKVVTDLKYSFKKVSEDQYSPKKISENQYSSKDVSETLYPMEEISENDQSHDEVTNDQYLLEKVSEHHYPHQHSTVLLVSTKSLSISLNKYIDSPMAEVSVEIERQKKINIEDEDNTQSDICWKENKQIIDYKRLIPYEYINAPSVNLLKRLDNDTVRCFILCLSEEFLKDILSILEKIKNKISDNDWNGCRIIVVRNCFNISSDILKRKVSKELSINDNDDSEDFSDDDVSDLQARAKYRDSKYIKKPETLNNVQIEEQVKVDDFYNSFRKLVEVMENNIGMVFQISKELEAELDNFVDIKL